MTTVTLNLCLYERLFIEVFALLLVFIHPQIGKHFGYFVGHQSTEDGVSGILCGRRQNAHIYVFLHVEQVANLLGDNPPLVITKVVDDNEKHFFASIEQWKNLVLKQIGTHHRPVGLRRSYPLEIMLLDVLGKSEVGLFFLHLQHLCHTAVCRTQFQFPVNQSFVDIHPIAQRLAIHYLHGDVLETLLIARLRHLRYNFFAVDVLFKRQQNLVGVHGFDEIVGYF